MRDFRNEGRGSGYVSEIKTLKASRNLNCSVEDVVSSFDHTKGDDWVLPLKLMTCSTASQSHSNIKSVILVASCATDAVIRELLSLPCTWSNVVMK